MKAKAPDKTMAIAQGSAQLSNPASPPFWGGVVVLSLCVCALLSARWEEKLAVAGNGVLLRAQGLGDARSVEVADRRAEQGGTRGNAGPQVFQRIDEKKGILSAEYGFLNFNNDSLHVGFSISAKDLAVYKRGYGYAQAELDALYQWQKKALADAYQNAVKNRLKQEQLDRMSEQVKAEYRSKFLAFLQSRGFVVLPGNVLAADIPAIVKHNVKSLQPVALALGDVAKKHGYGSEETVSAALSLVQTALLYENVPMQINGRQTGGIYPPVETMVRGKGDCDTKTSLLASILLNWDRMRLVGVGVPNHYLMGILRNPAKGDAFVEYNGLRFVLIEPAGPAWMPCGAVGPKTMEMLRSGKDLVIEQLAAN
jgi:hypothetical protein